MDGIRKKTVDLVLLCCSVAEPDYIVKDLKDEDDAPAGSRVLTALWGMGGEGMHIVSGVYTYAVDVSYR